VTQPSRVIALGLLAGLVMVACGEDKSSRPSAPAATKAPKAADAGAQPQGDASPPKVDFQEVEFAENERSRDPFRTFSETFVEEDRTRVQSQRAVVLDRYSIDELKLVGIVTRIHPAKAMLVDPTGKGHVIHRGQFVGRPEVVTGGVGGTTYEINWRVDNIRDGDIVLVREDPKNPDVPSMTRVIPLRPEGSIVVSGE
jgi:type IV pilus assembly protein PilP